MFAYQTWLEDIVEARREAVERGDWPAAMKLHIIIGVACGALSPDWACRMED